MCVCVMDQIVLHMSTLQITVVIINLLCPQLVVMKQIKRCDEWVCLFALFLLYCYGLGEISHLSRCSSEIRVIGL